ncbi:leucine Rich repeat-containing domain protein [Cooperia oncophora]
MNNTAIQMLDLRNNSLSDVGIVKICEALRNPEVVKKTSLTALVLWNNKITANAMDAVACALCENTHLETLNIGSNPLGELGVQRLRPALGGNGSNLHRIGLQSTQMTCQSAILLAECLADNSTLIRVDLRDNPGIGSAGLLALHSAMKINCSISLLNLDQSCVVASNLKVRPYQEDFRRYYEDIKRYCERNKRAVQQKTENDPACENVSKPAKNEESSKESEAKQQEEVKPADSVATEADHSPSHGQALPSFSNGTTSSGNRGKFVRSSSLTCTETVADIHERLRVLGGSTHSLDEANTDSTKTIKKCSTSSHNALGLTEWGSLPAIPQASLAAKPVVRKLRRFSVSPSSSTFDVSKPLQASSAPIQEHPPRPKTLAVGIPGTSEGLPLSTVKTCSSLPDLVNSGSSALDARASDNKNTSVEKGSSADHSSAASTDKQDKEDSSSAAATEMKKSHRNPCSDGSTADADVEECSHQVLPCQPPSEDMMRDVRIVIGDLVNYVLESSFLSELELQKK